MLIFLLFLHCHLHLPSFCFTYEFLSFLSSSSSFHSFFPPFLGNESLVIQEHNFFRRFITYRINPPIRRGFFQKKKAPKNPDPSYNRGLWPYRYFRQSPVVPRGHGKCRSSKPVEGYNVYLCPLIERAAR